MFVMLLANALIYGTRCPSITYDGSKSLGCDFETARMLRTSNRCSANTQVRMKGALEMLRLPAAECPMAWIRQPRSRRPRPWDSMEDQPVPLERSLFGHPVAGLLWETRCKWENPTRQHAAQKTPKALRYWLQEKFPTTRRQEVDNNTSDDSETLLRTCNQRLKCREKFAHVLFVIYVHNVESEHCLLRMKVASEDAHCKCVRSTCQAVLVVTLCLSGRCVALQSQLCVTRSPFPSSPPPSVLVEAARCRVLRSVVQAREVRCFIWNVSRGNARAAWPYWTRLPLPPLLCLWRYHVGILGSPWLRRPPRNFRASQLTCHAGVGPDRARCCSRWTCGRGSCAPAHRVIFDFLSPDVARVIVAEHDPKVRPSEVVQMNSGIERPSLPSTTRRWWDRSGVIKFGRSQVCILLCACMAHTSRLVTPGRAHRLPRASFSLFTCMCTLFQTPC